MCGIAAAWARDADSARAAVAAMCEQMVARGPDDEGSSTHELGGGALVLGSRRLAIIDPSPAGHQPMRDAERGTEIVFNGMIYNFRELREQLQHEGERFSSGCDTEVVLRAYGRWGAECVNRLQGMFAFAVADERREELFLARDRLGIKPLYYHAGRERLLVASQVKALLASGEIPLELDAAAIRSYLATGAVVEPLTAVEGVLALPAGHAATVRLGEEPDVRRYWSPPPADDGVIEREEAARELRPLLEQTVERHLVSDAPLGVFLSGGVDSSLVAALAARATDDLHTVSVTFPGSDLSEERYMRLVASRLGSRHVQVDLRGGDFAAELDAAFAAMDQPSFDGINTFLVSKAAAASGLKVALSGLGADELFDGYGFVGRVAALERARSLPPTLQRLGGLVLHAANGRSALVKTRQWLEGEWPRGRSYELLRSLFAPHELERLGPAAANAIRAPDPVEPGGDLFNQVTVLDLSNYTRNVLLRDTDAMSMSQSLEVRVPYLDDLLVDYVLRLPQAVKAGRKAVLLAAAGDLLPREVVSRRKQGFALPLDAWLRGELAADARERLAEPPHAVAELVDPAAMRSEWEAFAGGDRRWQRPWALYALCRWFESAATTAAAAAPR